jgi:hypothetical protein
MSVLAPSVGDMEHAWVAHWRTVYCPVCRRERRHFTSALGETCSWCGDLRGQGSAVLLPPTGPRR